VIVSRAGAGRGGSLAGRSPSRARWPGEAFGLSPGAGGGLRRESPVDVEQIAALRAWSLRLRVAATAFTHLATVVLTGCAEAGLVGPAGDALRELGADVAQQADEAAEEATAAADELDHHAVVLLATPRDPQTGVGGVDGAALGGAGERR
jgi:hypothetical protein